MKQKPWFVPIPYRSPDAPECRQLMSGGEWLIPEDEAKKVAEERRRIAPPVEEDRRTWELRKPPVHAAGGVSFTGRGGDR